MRKSLLLTVLLAGLALLPAGAGWADVPAPPANQTIGKLDVALGNLTEADCRACHDPGLPDRHHLLYGQPIPAGSQVPYPDADGDGSPDTAYGCLNCHDSNFTAVVRDCIVCHTSNAHHSTPAAMNGDCKSCHGAIVDNIGDGHYIPTYATSLVTPSASEGQGLPLNSRGKGAGACDYCHDYDGLSPPVILNNMKLHHGASSNCLWCHAVHNPTQMRICEGCHGPDSLHNIQADSPKAPTGTIVVGDEDAGYGHVGKNNGPGDSDCWGCHGYAIASAPGSGPLIPTIFGADVATVTAGADAMVVLTGSAFTNLAGGALFESHVALTGADGSSVKLTPDLLDQGLLAVTIPGDTPPGNYDLRAVKADFESNPASVSIVPTVVITGVADDGTVTIRGSGFGGYAEGSSGTFVTATGIAGAGGGQEKKSATTTEVGTIVSWSDTRIKVRFGSTPEQITVYSLFGAATSEVKTITVGQPAPGDEVGNQDGNRKGRRKGNRNARNNRKNNERNNERNKGKRRNK